MSGTRLLMLGAVRIFQPVHGYFVRRELLTWRVDQWASLNPGSIYNALRTLARDGFLEELGTESAAGRPARTSYRLTDDGEQEYLTLLRDALWRVHQQDPRLLYTALSFMVSLSREEVEAALEHRIAQIDAAHAGLPFILSGGKAIPGKPMHWTEAYRLGDARLQGERAWAVECLTRLRAGEYTFAGEG